MSPATRSGRRPHAAHSRHAPNNVSRRLGPSTAEIIDAIDNAIDRFHAWDPLQEDAAEIIGGVWRDLRGWHRLAIRDGQRLDHFHLWALSKLANEKIPISLRVGHEKSLGQLGMYYSKAGDDFNEESWRFLLFFDNFLQCTIRALKRVHNKHSNLSLLEVYMKAEGARAKRTENFRIVYKNNAINFESLRYWPGDIDDSRCKHSRTGDKKTSPEGNDCVYELNDTDLELEDTDLELEDTASELNDIAPELDDTASMVEEPAPRLDDTTSDPDNDHTISNDSSHNSDGFNNNNLGIESEADYEDANEEEVPVEHDPRDSPNSRDLLSGNSGSTVDPNNNPGDQTFLGQSGFQELSSDATGIRSDTEHARIPGQAAEENAMDLSPTESDYQNLRQGQVRSACEETAHWLSRFSDSQFVRWQTENVPFTKQEELEAEHSYQLAKQHRLEKIRQRKWQEDCALKGPELLIKSRELRQEYEELMRCLHKSQQRTPPQLLPSFYREDGTIREELQQEMDRYGKVLENQRKLRQDVTECEAKLAKVANELKTLRSAPARS